VCVTSRFPRDRLKCNVKLVQTTICMTFDIDGFEGTEVDQSPTYASLMIQIWWQAKYKN